MVRLLAVPLCHPSRTRIRKEGWDSSLEQIIWSMCEVSGLVYETLSCTPECYKEASMLQYSIVPPASPTQIISAVSRLCTMADVSSVFLLHALSWNNISYQKFLPFHVTNNSLSQSTLMSSSSPILLFNL
ncbi:unnamed protein product [Discosporangium mesarthrocarpum]